MGSLECVFSELYGKIQAYYLPQWKRHARYSPSYISQCFVEKLNARGSFVHWLHPTVHSSSYRICTVNSGCPDEHTPLVHQAVACQHKRDLPTLFRVAHSGDELHSKRCSIWQWIMHESLLGRNWLTGPLHFTTPSTGSSTVNIVIKILKHWHLGVLFNCICTMSHKQLQNRKRRCGKEIKTRHKVMN